MSKKKLIRIGRSARTLIESRYHGSFARVRSQLTIFVSSKRKSSSKMKYMERWEYLSIKLYEFGSDEAELKRPNEYWVSDYGLLTLLRQLGQEGWEVTCQVGKDLICKRPAGIGEPELANVGRAAVRSPK